MHGPFDTCVLVTLASPLHADTATSCCLQKRINAMCFQTWKSNKLRVQYVKCCKTCAESTPACVTHRWFVKYLLRRCVKRAYDCQTAGIS